jgi:hypothetical protein
MCETPFPDFSERESEKSSGFSEGEKEIRANKLSKNILKGLRLYDYVNTWFVD